ncbi:MAG: hypothetical protein HY023_02870 [Chloroflexi bacterium]|nr:hypothetical protein [Chloroflexota bacterium]
MIRPFDWRDVGIVRRLSEQGVCLDAETCYTRGWHSLQSALLGYLAPGVGTPTFVWRRAESSGRSAAFGQMRHRPGDEHARLLFIAPGYAPESGGAWEELIERFMAEAGERGAHNLIAEVEEASGEFEALRRLGFAIYARQNIWRLDGLTLDKITPGTTGLRPQQASDAWGVQTLYANVVPRLVQQVESPPNHNGRGYVLVEDGEVVAFLDVGRGPLGVWCEPFLHPEAYDRSSEVIASFLRLIAERDARPVYYCVRSYQDWLHEPLAEAGFEQAGEQAVMVKRLVVRLAEVERSPVAVLESSRAKVTSPMVKSTRRGNGQTAPANGIYAKTNY